MVPQSRDYFRFARAVLFHFAKTRRIWWAEYEALMRDLVRHEGKFSGCEGKAGFDTFEQASGLAQRRVGKDGHRHRKVYRCKVCGRYHLATLDSDVRRAHDRLKQLRRAA